MFRVGDRWLSKDAYLEHLENQKNGEVVDETINVKKKTQSKTKTVKPKVTKPKAAKSKTK